jgi:hypothetical protein
MSADVKTNEAVKIEPGKEKTGALLSIQDLRGGERVRKVELDESHPRLAQTHQGQSDL